MIIPDVNLLLYAYDSSAPRHTPARLWWENVLSAVETVGMSWQAITAFIRISTNPRAYLHPLSAQEAVMIVQTWLDRPNVQVVAPSARHWVICSELVVVSQTTGSLVMDAHLAALAIEYGAILCTHDADFTRFRGLRTYDPLTE